MPLRPVSRLILAAECEGLIAHGAILSSDTRMRHDRRADWTHRVGPVLSTAAPVGTSASFGVVTL